MLTDEEWRWAGLWLASFAGFLVSSTTGVGAALVLVPTLTYAFGARVAVAIMAPVLLCNSAIKLAIFHAHVDRRVAALALCGGVPGAILGALLTTGVPELWLRRLVAAIILSYVAQSLLLGERALRLGPTGVVTTSFATGVASGLSSAGGPTNVIALQGAGLVKEAFLATGAVVSVVLQLVKLPVYLASGVLTVAHLPLVLGLAVSAGLAALVGRRAVRRMSARTFRRGLTAMLLLLALGMLR